jgi:MoaA/NifB/PqqE/SkfB family radical SAM enzyme
MNIYSLQNIYRHIRNRSIRLVLLRAARVAGLRTLLVRMDLSNYCNIRCAMCHVSAPALNKESGRLTMPLGDFKKIANDIFWQTRSLHLSCAYEPLVVKHFDRCLVVSKEFRIPFVSFATNAMLMDEHTCDVMIKSAIDEVVVSADGSTASTFESIRRGAIFSRLIQNLELLKDLKARRNRDKPVLRMNYTLMDKNIMELPAFIDKFSDLGMKVLELRPLKRLVEELDVEDDLTQEGIKAYNRLFSAIQRACFMKNIRLIALPQMAAHDKVERRKEKPSSVNLKKNPCILPLTTLQITATGDLKLCMCEQPVVGNILDKRYEDIMNSERARQFLRSVAALPNPTCDTCPLRDELIA